MKQERFTCLIIWLLIYIGFSCTRTIERKAENSFTDDLGREITIHSTSRILSLTPSVTELIATFIGQDRIIARTPYDSLPEWLLDKPLISNYPVDFEKIIAMAPDLVLAKEGMVSMEDVQKISDLGIPVYMQRIDSLSDITRSIRRLGLLLDREAKANQVADSLEKVISSVSYPDKPGKCPSVLLLISEEPVFAYGLNSYASDMIVAAGGKNAIPTLYDNPFPALQREYILKINPDIIIGVDSSAMLRLYPELSVLKAFSSGSVHKMNMELISKPGPRVAEGIKELNRLIYAH